MSVPKGFEGAGSYSICPLCDEHIKQPDVPVPPPGVFWDPWLMSQRLFREHEAALEEHLKGHTAAVMLS